MKILIVDDDEQIVSSLIEGLSEEDTEFSTAFSGEEAVEKLTADFFDIVLIDLVMPEMNGLEVLKAVNASVKKSEFIMITGFGTIENAIEAMKLGATDYLTKPINLDELRLTVKRVKEKVNLSRENQKLKTLLTQKHEFNEMIGSTPAMQRIKEIIVQVANKKVTVLIGGESGTGKELVANAVYKHSNRVGKPYLKVNCGALSQNILESELFGHEKGSFTGASALKKGLFESANGGTIFLDEIGEMPFESQVKLLRVLESGEYSRVGGVATLKTDVRIVAATNKDLEEEVKNGNFREDLFYRLNVIHINLPPLRERKDDIPFLVKRFIELYNVENGTAFESMTSEILDFLAAQQWKGNIRELRNVVEKILVFASSPVVPFTDLPDELLKTSVVQPMDELHGTMSQIERKVIEQTLAQTKGNVRRVSRILDIPLRTLYRKLKNYSVQETDSGEGSTKESH